MTTLIPNPINKELQIKLASLSNFSNDKAIREAYYSGNFSHIILPLEESLKAVLESSNQFDEINISCIFEKNTSPIRALSQVYLLYTDGSQRNNIKANDMKSTSTISPAYSSVILISQYAVYKNNILDFYWHIDTDPIKLVTVNNLTNNQAELLAIVLAGQIVLQKQCDSINNFNTINTASLNIADNKLDEFHILDNAPNLYFYIISDSPDCINSINSWMQGWGKTWSLESSKQKPKENTDIWKSLYDCLNLVKQKATLLHIRGHNGNLGNCLADISMEHLNDVRVINQIISG